MNKHATKKAAVWKHKDGRKMTTIEWASALGIKPDSLRARVRRGYSIEEAVSLPRDFTDVSQRPNAGITTLAQ